MIENQSPKTRQAHEIPVSTLEHMQVQNWIGQNGWSSKRSLFAHTPVENASRKPLGTRKEGQSLNKVQLCSMETSRN